MNKQQISKILTYFRTNYSLHDPYCFLIDGNFITTLINKQYQRQFEEKLPTIFNAKARFYTTSCIIRQLQLLGKQFKIVLQQANRYRKLHCNHQLQVSVDECIMSRMSQNLQETGYIVCTQDIQLRRKLRNFQHVPIMYFGPDQRITMQDIQKKNLQMLRQRIHQKLMPKENQMADIEALKQQQKQRAKEQQKEHRKRIAATMGLQIKKIARGPNPLSVKKKHHTNQKELPSVEPKKKRIRKRKNKSVTENDS